MHDHPLLYTHRLPSILFFARNRSWAIKYFPTKYTPPFGIREAGEKTHFGRGGYAYKTALGALGGVSGTSDREPRAGHRVTPLDISWFFHL